MSNQKLKDLLIDKILTTDNNLLLEEANRLLDMEIDESAVYLLSEEEKANIQEGIQEIKKGDSFTNEQANQLINEWLKK